MPESKTTKCRAKNQATCPYHGSKLVFQEIIKDINDQAKQSRLGNIYILSTEQAEEAFPVIEPIIDEAITLANNAVKTGTEGQYVLEIKLVNQIRDLPYDARVALKEGTSVIWSKEIARVVYQNANKNLKLPPDSTNELLLKPKGEDGYKYLLAKMLQENGSPVSKNGSRYGWHDVDATKHIWSCGGIDYISGADEDTWYEFAGSFAEGDDTIHGLSAKAICKCGAWRGTVRWEGNVSEAIRLAFTYFE